MAKERLGLSENNPVLATCENVRKSGRVRAPPNRIRGDFLVSLKPTSRKRIPAMADGAIKSSVDDAPVAKRARMSPDDDAGGVENKLNSVSANGELTSTTVDLNASDSVMTSSTTSVNGAEANSISCADESEVTSSSTTSNNAEHEDMDTFARGDEVELFLQMNDLRIQDVTPRFNAPVPHHVKLNDFVARFLPPMRFEEKTEMQFQQESNKPKSLKIEWVPDPYREVHFVFKKNLGTGKREKTVEYTYMCSICRRTFSARYKMCKHLLLHSRSFVVSCDVCDEDFSDLRELLRHRKSHEAKHGGLKDQVTYACDRCPERFAKTTSLLSHRECEHFPEIKRILCRLCKETFPVREQLVEHLKSHEETSYICVLCNRDFGNYYEHLNHEYHCLRQLPGTLCDLCDERFSSFKSLREHEAEAHNLINCGRVKYNFHLPAVRHPST